MMQRVGSVGFFVAAMTLLSCVEAKTFTPAGGMAVSTSDKVHRLNEGGTSVLSVMVERGAARDEELSLEVGGLPVGVTAEPALVEAGSSTGSITLHANGAVLKTESEISITAHGNGLSAQTTARIFIAGRPGDIDLSFGEEGKRSYPFFTSKLVPLSSGALLLVGDVAGTTMLLKLTSEGEYDESFGNGGFATISLPAGRVQARSTHMYVVERSDGKLVWITALDDPGTSAVPDTLATGRLHSDGSLDTSYGTLGYSTDGIPYRPYGVGLGQDDELLIWNGNNNSRLTRINSNGGIGSSSTTFLYPDVIVTHFGLLVQSDGKILVPFYEPPNLKPALFRFESSLQLDPSFGRSGRLSLNVIGFGYREHSDGSYSTVGSALDVANAPAMMRFSPTWQPLPGFESGRVILPGSGGFVASLSLSGATVAYGTINNAVKLARMMDDGTLDSSYGVDGVAGVTARNVSDLTPGFAIAPQFGLYVLVSRDSTQNTEVYRVWQ